VIRPAPVKKKNFTEQLTEKEHGDDNADSCVDQEVAVALIRTNRKLARPKQGRQLAGGKKNFVTYTQE
jgi:hypothetical protein